MITWFFNKTSGTLLQVMTGLKEEERFRDGAPLFPANSLVTIPLPSLRGRTPY